MFPLNHNRTKNNLDGRYFTSLLGQSRIATLPEIITLVMALLWLLPGGNALGQSQQEMITNSTRPLPPAALVAKGQPNSKRFGLVNDFPVIGADPALICSDITFYTPEGQKRQGEKTCHAGGESLATQGLNEVILKGSTVGGVIGSLSVCKATGESGCFAGAGFQAGLPQAPSALVYTICKSDGEVGCHTASNSGFVAGRKDNITASQLVVGAAIAGIQGSLPVCDTSGQVNCFVPATGELQAANGSNLSPDNIRTGAVIGGIAGRLVLPTASDVRAGIIYGSSGEQTGDMTLPSPSNVITGVSYGLAGNEYTGSGTVSPGACDSDSPEQDCVASGDRFAAEACTTDGQEDCFVASTTNFDAVDRSSVNAGDIRESILIAGMMGTLQLPEVSDVRDGTTYGANGNELSGVLELPAATYVETGVGYGSNSTELLGNGGVPPHPFCSSSPTQGCVAAGSYYAGVACTANSGR